MELLAILMFGRTIRQMQQLLAFLLGLVYDDDFKVAGHALSILICSMCGLALLVALTSVLTAAGRPKASMAVVLVCLPMQLLLGLWLIPQYGMRGTAVANLLSVGTGVVVAAVFVRRQLGVLFDVPQVAKALGLSLPAAYVLFVAAPQLPSLALPLLYAGAFAIYGGGMVLLGGFHADEVSKVLKKLRYCYTSGEFFPGFRYKKTNL